MTAFVKFPLFLSKFPFCEREIDCGPIFHWCRWRGNEHFIIVSVTVLAIAVYCRGAHMLLTRSACCRDSHFIWIAFFLCSTRTSFLRPETSSCRKMQPEHVYYHLNHILQGRFNVFIGCWVSIVAVDEVPLLFPAPIRSPSTYSFSCSIFCSSSFFLLKCFSRSLNYRMIWAFNWLYQGHVFLHYHSQWDPPSSMAFSRNDCCTSAKGAALRLAK